MRFLTSWCFHSGPNKAVAQLWRSFAEISAPVSCNLKVNCRFLLSSSCVRPYTSPVHGIWFQRRCKGHSKWQNIKSTKQAMDMKRSRVTSKILRHLDSAIRENKHLVDPTDPFVNTQLGNVLEEARKQNISKAVIDRRIQRAKTVSANKERVYICGPTGSVFALEVFTEQLKPWIYYFRRHLSISYKKQFFVMDQEYGATHFNEKGIIKIRPSVIRSSIEVNANNSIQRVETLEDVENLAIEVEAEEVAQVKDEDQGPLFEMMCDPKRVHKIQEALLNMGIDVESAEVELLPLKQVEVSEEDAQLVEKFFEDCSSDYDVERIFDNIAE